MKIRTDNNWNTYQTGDVYSNGNHMWERTAVQFTEENSLRCDYWRPLDPFQTKILQIRQEHLDKDSKMCYTEAVPAKRRIP